MLLIPLLLIGSCHICMVSCSGYLSIQFLQFVSNGHTATGALCDDATTVGGYDPCDPQFTLTVKRATLGIWTSLIEYKQAEVYLNQDTVNFGASFGQLPNPVIVGMPFDDNQGTVLMTVKVVDSGLGTTLEKTITIVSANLKTSGSETVHLELKDELNHVLSLNYWYSCNSNYYGELCNTYCRAANDNVYGHSWCTSAGLKVCLYGWVDASTDCRKPHPCRTCVCQNGGTCVPQAEGYSCICQTDFSGANCQTCDPRSSKCSSASSGTTSGSCDLSTAAQCPSCPVCQTPTCPGNVKTGTRRADVTAWLTPLALLLLAWLQAPCVRYFN